MGSVNKVILVGNLGRDADFTTTAGGVTIARFSVATTTRAKNSQSGTWEDRTEGSVSAGSQPLDWVAKPRGCACSV